MEHNSGIPETNVSPIPSLLKVFEMFQMRLFYYKHDEEENFVEAIAIKFINFDMITSLI